MKTRILFICFLLTGTVAWAQSGQDLLNQILEEEKNTVDALVLYPESTRMAILEASLYPEVLVKMETMQSNTSNAFTALMEGYPRETQEKLWDLTRYPDLINRLAAGAEPPEQLNRILADYPEEIRQTARMAQVDYYDLLHSMHKLMDQSESAFNSLIREYPPKAQTAFQQLVDLPEVLTLLTGNIRLTVMVGDLYRREPEWLTGQLDSLNLVAAREHARELEDWKTSLDNDPEARAELVNTANEFSKEYSYDDEYYDYDEAEPAVVEHHYYYHYPYWFGYPSWYVYPRWRRYPLWYEWGFYTGPGNTVVIIDLPSFYFTNWYFHYPVHHYRYPGLSAHFADFYYYHPRSGGSITVSVNTWRKQNRDVITDDWLDKARRDRSKFKEFGQFERSREDYNRSHADKQLTQREYLDKNTRKYPDLAKEAPRAIRQTEPAGKTVSPKQPAERPRTTAPETAKPPVTRKKNEPAKTVNPPVKETRPRTVPKNNEIPKVDKAQDFHRQKWEKNQPEKTGTAAKTPPQRTRSDTKAPVEKKETPKRGKNGN